MNAWQSVRDLVSKWWILLIIGILSVIAGIALFCSPLVGTTTVAIIASVSFLLMGIQRIIFVISNRDRIPAWGWDLIGAILLTIAGVALLCSPGAQGFILYLMYSIGFIGGGISGIARSIAMKKVEGSHWLLSLIFAILTIAMGIFLLLNPVVALLSIGLMAGFAMVFNGINLIVSSIAMSKTNSTMKSVEEKYAGK